MTTKAPDRLCTSLSPDGQPKFVSLLEAQWHAVKQTLVAWCLPNRVCSGSLRRATP